MTVRYVVAGPTRHGVVRHALRLGASDPFLSRALVRAVHQRDHVRRLDLLGPPGGE